MGLRSRAVKVLSGALLVLLTGCDRSVPEEQTSLVLDPGVDPGPPPEPLTLMWQHQSTGNRILDGGLREALEENNIDFYDIDHQEGDVDGYVIGEHTKPRDFPTNFGTPKYFEVLRTWELGEKKSQHDIIMFKSCYPASDIETDEELERYKGWYSSLLPTFRAHPDIVFIAMSTPPRVKSQTTPEEAARARRWSKWITTEYAKDVKNVRVFDLFDALAIREGYPDENTLVPQFAQSVNDSHPSPLGGAAATRLFIPWLNRVVRESGLVEDGIKDW